MATTTKTSETKSTGAETQKSGSSKKASGMTGKMKNSEFHKFFVDELKDIYWAEKHLVKALPKLKKAATSPELAQAFEKHALETQGHIEVLEQVFALLEEKPQAKKCEAMEGLLAESESIISDTEKGTMVRDAGLVLAAQKVEHYEIGTYGALRTFAECMGHTEVVNLLQQTLDNEKQTDALLTEVAVGFINDAAVQE
ncbi:MAG: rubrerythrin family protein [Pedobacter sp.]|jgi:ferritin-like metal-binding protein YciE|nr:rubrerythrin family protein [Pedobacter sp.]